MEASLPTPAILDAPAARAGPIPGQKPHGKPAASRKEAARQAAARQNTAGRNRAGGPEPAPRLPVPQGAGRKTRTRRRIMRIGGLRHAARKSSEKPRLSGAFAINAFLRTRATKLAACLHDERWGPGDVALKPDREQTFAKTALDLMGECGVAPRAAQFRTFLCPCRGREPRRQPRHQRNAGAQEALHARNRCSDLRAHGPRARRRDGPGRRRHEFRHQRRAGPLERRGPRRRSTTAAHCRRPPASWTPNNRPPICASWWTVCLPPRARWKTAPTAWKSELQKSSEQVSELRSKLDDVHKESLTDPLTGIANRKAFDNALAAAEAAVAESDDPVSLLLCDIDHFKKFNDTWGHQTGDQVLRLVASCLSENVKGRDTAARYGGEEFGVVLRGTALTRRHAHRRTDPRRGGRPPAGEEIHRRRAGHHHHLHRRGPVRAARNGGSGCTPGRCLPLWRQAEWPQSGDLRKRSRAWRCFHQRCLMYIVPGKLDTGSSSPLGDTP